jgi:steroid delta-isomerase-like uncharacterized protein
MSTQSIDNKTIVRRWFEEVWNQGDLAVADEILDRPESVKQYIRTFRAAFPDIRHTVEEMVAEGGTVVARWSAHGTHTGQWHGLAPTNQPVTYAGITIAEIQEGKITRHQTIWDTLAVLEQLGAVAKIRKEDGSRL